jgi:hypothetical protein
MTSGVLRACDVKYASCMTVSAVVASSTRRRFIMMVVPGRFLAEAGEGRAGAERLGRPINR